MRRKLVVILVTVMFASVSVVGCGKDGKTSVTESKKVLTVTEHKKSEQDDIEQETENKESTEKRKNLNETEEVAKKEISEKENSKDNAGENESKKEESKKDSIKKKDVLNKTEKSASDKKQEDLKNLASLINSSSKSTTNTNTGNNQENSNQAETKPIHQHNYIEQTHTVHHDATGHNEQYEVQAAWDEEKTTYEDYAWSCCNVCGADCTADPSGHAYQHAIKGEGGGHHTEYDSRPVTTTVHHDAVYGTRWVEDSAAYDETVVDGYVCSCGARK